MCVIEYITHKLVKTNTGTVIMGRCGWILLLTVEVALAADTCAKDSLDEECGKQLSGGPDDIFTTAADQFKRKAGE